MYIYIYTYVCMLSTGDCPAMFESGSVTRSTPVCWPCFGRSPTIAATSRGRSHPRTSGDPRTAMGGHGKFHMEKNHEKPVENHGLYDKKYDAHAIRQSKYQIIKTLWETECFSTDFAKETFGFDAGKSPRRCTGHVRPGPFTSTG